MTTTFTVRQAPTGVPVATVPFPEDTEGHDVAQYVITYAPPLRKGMAHRYLVWVTLLADGLALNDNLPVACLPTREAAIARAEYAGLVL